MIRSSTQPLSRTTDERIGQYLSAALRSLPLLAGLTAAGLVVIYLMGLVRVLEPVGWQLLAAAVILGLIAVAHRSILGLAGAGSGLLALRRHALVMAAAAIALAVLWEGIAPLAILAAWVPPIICIPARVPRRSYGTAMLTSLLGTVIIIVLARLPFFPRLASNTTGSFAAVLLVTSMVILFILLVLATHAIRYRTLESRLVGTLVPIIAVPILFTTAIAAYNALSSSQQQFLNSLEAVSSLKRAQLNAIVQASFSDLSSIQQGSQQAPNIMHVLRNLGSTDEAYRLNVSQASTQIRNFISRFPAGNYEEILIVDREGNVILSTYLLNQGVNFGDQDFFQQGLVNPTSRFMRYPGRQNAALEYKLVTAVPFFGETPDEILGVIVATAGPDAVLGVLQPSAGLAEINTYLVDAQLNPVLADASPVRALRGGEIAQVVENRAGSGSGTYFNYAVVPVLGFYDWDPQLQAAIVAEVSQATVFARSLAAVLASGLVGLITIIIAAIAVLSASRAISEPVHGLAQAASSLAAGNLSTRAAAPEREDEIGRLAGSFNSMARQLQATIGNLERRVAERTNALEAQTLRLRTAAEVARDATLAPSLDELLARTARLVLERFGVDHVGIFLLDERRQYAVLQAAPPGVGHQMLAEQYRVLVGDRRIVGQAAAAGEAQLVLRGPSEAIQIGDEFHPDTLSQLSLPLRTNEGTIGVLDLQSNRQDAFNPADASVFQVLADQLAAAIERDRLLLQVQERLGQLERSYRLFTEQSWAQYGSERKKVLGYRYDSVRLDPVESISPEAGQVLQTGSTLISGQDNGAGAAPGSAAVPIRLRGKTLGVISVQFQGGQVAARTVTMLEQAADRLATALENVRLLEDSLRRAAKERMIAEITSKIGSSISVRNVVQTAVEELGRALPGSDVTIRFGSPSAADEKDVAP